MAYVVLWQSTRWTWRCGDCDFVCAITFDPKTSWATRCEVQAQAIEHYDKSHRRKAAGSSLDPILHRSARWGIFEMVARL